MKIKLLIRSFFLAVSVFLICTPSTAQTAVFVFIQIPEAIEPFEREEKYGNPLNLVLVRENVGEVSGGGSMLSAPKTDGTQDIEWVGIDVDLVVAEKGVTILKRELIKLGAPQETILEIHLPTGIKKLVLGKEGWW